MRYKRMRSSIPWITAVVASLLLTVACSYTDCPLNNTVSARFSFLNSTTKATTTITDTLTVTTAGSDSVLLNRAYKISSMQIPMGYVQMVDTLLLHFGTSAGTVTDSVFVSHTNIPHFVSLDCGTAVFHEITAVKWTKRTATENFPTAIDSIVISNRIANYDEKENFKVYIHTY